MKRAAHLAPICKCDMQMRHVAIFHAHIHAEAASISSLSRPVQSKVSIIRIVFVFVSGVESVTGEIATDSSKLTNDESKSRSQFEIIDDYLFDYWMIENDQKWAEISRVLLKMRRIQSETK